MSAALLTLAILLVPLAFVGGVVFAFVKAPRATTVIGLAIALVLTAGWKSMLHAHHVGHLPGAFGVWRVLYVSEEAWGFGPGGNEAGFLVYPLPERTADAVETSGLPWLEALRDAPRSSEGWRGRFSDWRPTPIRPSARWMPDPASGRYDIVHYVCRYGFCIDIDAQHLRDAEDAVNSPGA